MIPNLHKRYSVQITKVKTIIKKQITQKHNLFMEIQQLQTLNPITSLQEYKLSIKRKRYIILLQEYRESISRLLFLESKLKEIPRKEETHYV